MGRASRCNTSVCAPTAFCLPSAARTFPRRLLYTATSAPHAFRIWQSSPLFTLWARCARGQARPAMTRSRTQKNPPLLSPFFCVSCSFAPFPSPLLLFLPFSHATLTLCLLFTHPLARHIRLPSDHPAHTHTSTSGPVKFNNMRITTQIAALAASGLLPSVMAMPFRFVASPDPTT